MAAGKRKEGESFSEYRDRLDNEQRAMNQAARGLIDRPAPVVNNPGDRASRRRMKLRGERA